MKPIVLTALLACVLAGTVSAAGPTATPILELASGLPGQQVRLTWPAEAGLRYRVEKSADLGADGLGWSAVALVEASGNSAIWVDPEPTTTRAFYRVTQPEIEVTEISPPLLAATGGTLQIHGQCIPAGSSLLLEIEGQAPLLVPLQDLGGGVWSATVSAPFIPGGAVVSAAIVDSGGTTLLELNQPITVTETGRADDSPPSLPPAAPMSAPGDPVPGIGMLTSIGEDDDCDGLDDDCDWAASTASWIGKKGYDYYKSSSDNAAAALQTNPYFVSSGMAGDMVACPSNSPGGLPGEVSFQVNAVSLPCPAGPPLAWTCTYRSMRPVSSGLGDAWDFAYNISIEALPASAGASAPRLVIRDGGGRADVFHRQPDGSYRCDGMFREGSFDGDVFTLTFADRGTWTFSPLDGSPDAGKIGSITDRNGVALVCTYDPAGQLASVSDAFGRSLLVEWDSAAPPRIAAVSSAQSGGAVFARTAFTYSAGERRLTAISAPVIPGRPPVAGDLGFSYTSGSPDPRLNGNLLEITDGAGRLLEAFLYSSSTTPSDISYDTCSSHDRNRIAGGGQVLRTNFALLLGGYTMTENDELGRVCETVFDTRHRVLSCREYTGFATPGQEVTATTNRPAGKLRASDPDFFETTCRYNSDSFCTALTHPDGSSDLVTYERDLKPDCPVRERGNARVLTLRAPGGETRTVTCDYLPGFGTCERDHSGMATGRRSRDASSGLATGRRSRDAASGLATGRRSRDAASGLATGRRSRDASSGLATGRRSRDPGSGLATGKRCFSPVSAALPGGGEDEDCDGFVTRMTTSLGQTTTWTYDKKGNCTAAISPLPGRGTLYQYNGFGRCTGVTVLNGAASSFHDELTYDGDTGFLLSVVSDSSGLQLSTTCARDDQGRVTGVTDLRGNDWLFAYNPLHQCVSLSTPAAPERITTTFTYDAGSLLARCDTAHLAPDGSPVAANPAYTTFFVHDLRGRLIRVAEEELPVDPGSLLVPDPATLANFAVCDIGYDAAGQPVSLSTPAACRMQAADEDCDFTYDERGLLHRCIAGGSGSPSSVTTECDYDASGALVRHAITGAGMPGLETLYSYDSFHRLASSTDAMGNVSSFSYANDGMVSCSLSGEILDEPGSAGNIELARFRLRQRPELLYQAWDDVLQDYIGSPGSGGGHGGALYMKAKEKANRTKCGTLRTACGTDPFFDVEVEDEVCIVERFTPGSPAEPVEEVIIVDRSPAGLVQSVTRNGDLVLTCAYDSAGRLATCSNGACTTALTRDAGGQVLICGMTDHFRIPGMPDKIFTVTRAYDALGRCVLTTDGTGNSATCAYDSLGRPVSETEPGGLIVRTSYDGSSATGPFSSEVSADADNDGDFEILSRSLSRCGGLVYSEDSYGHRTSFALDALGRLSSVICPDTTHEDYEYDLTGALHRVRGRTGTASFTRDLNLRVTGITHADLAPGIADPGETSFTFSGAGECMRCEKSGSLLEFSYDSLGNPLSESQNGRVTLREFNHRGRTKITYQDGRSFAESRDTLGQPLSISALDAGGLPMSPPVVTMEYAGERVWRSTQANGVVTTFNYRGDGQTAPPTDRSFDTCVEIASVDIIAHELAHVVQQRDRNQCVVSYSTTFSSSPQGSTGRFHTYTYDRLGRLTGCLTRRREVPGGPVILDSNVSYTLDLEGRRLSATGGANPGTYTQDNGIPPGDQQMGQYTTWPEGSVEWNDEGNLRSINRGTIAHLHAYDADGQLLSVTDPATSTVLASFAYDAAGRRSSSTISSGAGLPPVVTEFVYDGTECIQELTENPGTGQPDAAVTFVSSGGVKHCISTRNGTLYYPAGHAAEHWGDPHENLNGRYALMTTATGGVSERFDCDDAGKPVFLGPDGVPTSASSAVGPIRWMAPEAMWEPSVGLFLGGGSVYCPELGMTVCRGNGHVTVLKAAAKGGGHVTVLKAAAKGGGHVTVLKAAAKGGGHVTVLKAAAGGGMGGGGGGGKAQDHNSSRSNKSS